MLYKFGFDLIKNNKIMSIAIVVQLAISFVMLNFTVGIYNDVFIRLNIMKNFDLSNTIFYMNNDFMYESDLNDYKKEVGDSLIEPIYTCGFINKEDDINIYALAYGDETSKNLSYIMKEGQWYDKAAKEEGVINAVAFEGTQFNVGDVYETMLFSEDENKMKSVKLKVTGIVNNKTGFISDSKTSNNMETDILFEDVDLKSIGTNNWFLLNYNDLLELGATSEEMFLSTNMFIYSDGNTKEIIDALSDSGNALTLQGIIDNSSEVFAQKMHMVYPLAAGVLLSGIIGAECLLILNNLKNRKRFAILYICGMKWNDSIKISAIQLSYLLFAVAPLSIIFYGIISVTHILDLTEIAMFEINNIIVTGIIIAFMYLVSIITTKLMTAKTTPKDCLKNE